ncbi:TPA: hypothetical protein ACG3PB_003810 [Clostridioides difficile]
MKKIYLNQNNNVDDLCLELLQKLEILEVDEGQVIEIIAPINPFTSASIKLKTKVCQRLIQLRVKFVIRTVEQ